MRWFALQVLDLIMLFSGYVLIKKTVGTNNYILEIITGVVGLSLIRWGLYVGRTK